MSGHSKWHNIRERKSRVDAQKGQQFTKVAREIIMAAREGGSDPEGNFRLRLAIQKAKEVNMPKANIERAIQRGAGQDDSSRFEEVAYEGYGPGGVAVLVEAATDNRNRTVADIRSTFSKYGGNLGESGCVSWIFEKRGILTFNAKGVDQDGLLSCALEGGAEDLREEGSIIVVSTRPHDFEAVKEAVERGGYQPLSGEISMHSKTTVSVSQKEAQQLLKLLEVLEEHDDVQKVYANFDIEDKVLEELLS